MVMINNGLNRIRDLISTDMTLGTMGTSGTVASATDTDLITIESNSQKSITKTSTDQQIQVDFALSSTSGTTGTYREFKVHSAVYNYDRMVFTGIDWVKNGTEEISIIKKYFIKGN